MDEPLSNLGVLGGIFHFYSNSKRTLCEQVQTPRSAVSDQDLHCLPLPHKTDTMFIWLNLIVVVDAVAIELSLKILKCTIEIV